MAIKKSDLYSSLWASCDELRGGMDASQYKDYVLFMLFIKYVSDKYGDSDDFAPPVVIPKGASFKDMVALKGKDDIGDKINTQVIQPLIDANSRLARSDFPDFNDSNKLGDGAQKVEKLGNLIAIFENPALDFSRNRAENDDILGDAYEYLMRHFATESGKSKGQFIGLPANLFYGTGIPACIVVLDKENATARKGVFMIDASKGFKKDGPKNRLREQDLHKIVDTLTRQDETDPRYARMVPVAEIADSKNDFNLNLPRYIDSTEPEDLQDIDGHLRGGIPERDLDALGHYWKLMPGLRAALFGKVNRPGYAALKLPLAEVKPAIFSHPEFTAFTTKAKKLFTQWQTAVVPRLKGFAQNGHPKPLIETIAEELLATFKTAPLLDAYDVYQHLMDFWAETMQGRLLPHRRDWLEGGRAAPRNHSGQKDGGAKRRGRTAGGSHRRRG